MSERALVSVIMPAYNAAAYVADAIDSALTQDYRPIEVLVADDGSTDETAAVVRRYGEPVHYLRQENRGPAGARNLALRHARGEYIAFLDADDVWHPRKLAVQIPVMERDASIGICGARMAGFRDPRDLRWEEVRGEPERVPIDLHSVIVKNRFSTSTVVVRRAALKDAGEFDESIYGPEDWDLWRRITQGWGAVHLRAVLGGYRERHESVSSNASRMLENNRKVLGKAFADNPCLPWHIKRKALSYLHLDATLEYLSGSAACALWHLLVSWVLWPVPMGRDCCKPLTRARLAVRLPLQMVGIWGRLKGKG